MTTAAATVADVAQIVGIHKEAFPGFFLTSLGDDFLHRFYGALVHERDALCLVGRLGDRTCGFVVGLLHPAGFFRKLLPLRQWLGFCTDALPALVRQPGFVGRRLLRGLTYRGEEGPGMQEGAALVSSIAVLPLAAGSGLAGALLEAFCSDAAQRGASSVYLLTDREDNPAANRFYVKLGFAIDAEVVRPDGRAMNRYVRQLRKDTTNE